MVSSFAGADFVAGLNSPYLSSALLALSLRKIGQPQESDICLINYGVTLRYSEFGSSFCLANCSL